MPFRLAISSAGASLMALTEPNFCRSNFFLLAPRPLISSKAEPKVVFLPYVAVVSQSKTVGLIPYPLQQLQARVT